MFSSTLASASLVTSASFLVRVLYSWVITSVILEQVDRCNKKFNPSEQTVKQWNHTIQFTITATGNTMTLVHITTIPFYISIYFSFPDAITGYKHFFRCVNCYYICKIFSNTFLQIYELLWFRDSRSQRTKKLKTVTDFAVWLINLIIFSIASLSWLEINLQYVFTCY